MTSFYLGHLPRALAPKYVTLRRWGLGGRGRITGVSRPRPRTLRSILPTSPPLSTNCHGEGPRTWEAGGAWGPEPLVDASGR